MTRPIFAAAALCAALSGCVSHTWAPGPTASLPFEQASGQCQLVAMGAERPIGAAFWGSSSTVALGLGTSVLAGSIGNAVRENRAYNACLQAAGFVAADTP